MLQYIEYSKICIFMLSSTNRQLPIWFSPCRTKMFEVCFSASASCTKVQSVTKYLSSRRTCEEKRQDHNEPTICIFFCPIIRLEWQDNLRIATNQSRSVTKRLSSRRTCEEKQQDHNEPIKLHISLSNNKARMAG